MSPPYTHITLCNHQFPFAATETTTTETPCPSQKPSQKPSPPPPPKLFLRSPPRTPIPRHGFEIRSAWRPQARPSDTGGGADDPLPEQEHPRRTITYIRDMVVPDPLADLIPPEDYVLIEHTLLQFAADTYERT